MVSCIVVDDEPLARQLIESYIVQLPELTCVAICSGAVEAFSVLHNQQVDVMFLDIQMPGITGLNFLKSLKNPPKVIFTTAFPDHAVEAFELEATDYLLKPITLERFIKAIQKIVPKSENGNLSPIKQIENSYIFLKVNKRLVKVDHQNITYVESLGDYLKVHTAAETYVTNLTLSKLEALLPDNKFARIHRSTIINLDCVKYIEGNFVHLQEKDLAIGLTYKENLSQKLSQPD
jgi:DNA-binding LytR/AlgR family response regulator